MSELFAVFQIGSLGDSIVSLPTLLSIRELLPDCKEYILISNYDSKLKVLPSDIFDMAWRPSIRLQYSSQKNRLAQLRTVPALLAKLRYYRPRHCVYLLPADRTAEQVERDRRFFKAAGIKDLVGFKSLPVNLFQPGSSTSLEGTEAYQRFERVWGADTPEMFAKYARVPVLQPSADATQKVAAWLTANRRHPHKRLIAVSPYSNYPSRDIPEGALAKLMPQLADKADAEIVIVGGSKDFGRAAQLQNCSLNACGQFSVQESAALLKAASLCICTESGPMHLAAAVGSPLLATFSRINKQLARWLPFGQRSSILYRDVPCFGCDSPHCRIEGHPCMTLITADQIVCAALNLLHGLPVVSASLNGTQVLTW